MRKKDFLLLRAICSYILNFIYPLLIYPLLKIIPGLKLDLNRFSGFLFINLEVLFLFEIKHIGYYVGGENLLSEVKFHHNILHSLHL